MRQRDMLVGFRPSAHVAPKQAAVKACTHSRSMHRKDSDNNPRKAHMFTSPKPKTAPELSCSPTSKVTPKQSHVGHDAGDHAARETDLFSNLTLKCRSPASRVSPSSASIVMPTTPQPGTLKT
jgi:hypothetical protein